MASWESMVLSDGRYVGKKNILEIKKALTKGPAAYYRRGWIVRLARDVLNLDKYRFLTEAATCTRCENLYLVGYVRNSQIKTPEYSVFIAFDKLGPLLIVKTHDGEEVAKRHLCAHRPTYVKDAELEGYERDDCWDYTVSVL